MSYDLVGVDNEVVTFNNATMRALLEWFGQHDKGNIIKQLAFGREHDAQHFAIESWSLPTKSFALPNTIIANKFMKNDDYLVTPEECALFVAIASSVPRETYEALVGVQLPIGAAESDIPLHGEGMSLEERHRQLSDFDRNEEVDRQKEELLPALHEFLQFCISQSTKLGFIVA